MLRSFRPVINQQECRKCGLCYAYCPEGSIASIDGNYSVDYRHCKGCGICSNECPVKAIAMEREKPGE